jgi:hypothetical protein
MRGLLKMSGLSAVLSFALVTAYDQASSSQPDPSPKIYRDRLPGPEQAPTSDARPASSAALRSAAAAAKGDRLAAAADCADQTWPYIAPECMAASTDRPGWRQVRVITIEARAGANTSVLMRVPQADVASR